MPPAPPAESSRTSDSAATGATSRGYRPPAGRIYREESCHPDDIFYEGSEDEDYEHPDTRLRNCEDAAQRFLSGHAPLLISAALRGPFSRETGWLNPWRSKGRTLKAGSRRPHLDPSPFPRSLPRASQMDESTALPDSSLNCHLPSPESLKQAPFTEPHPFLRQGELATVQRWRSGIRSASPVDHPVPGESSSKINQPGGSGSGSGNNKRKRDDTNVKAATASRAGKSKRLKFAACAPQDASTSKRSASVPVTSARGSTIPESALTDSNGSATHLPACQRSDSEPIERPKETAGLDDELDDELSVSPATSRPSHSASQSRRASPRRKFGQTAIDPRAASSDDELSPVKRAAATLSSPISPKSRPGTARKRKEKSRAKSAREVAKLMDGGFKKGSAAPHADAEIAAPGRPDVEMTDAHGSRLIREHTEDCGTQTDQSFKYKLVQPRRGKRAKSSETSRPRAEREPEEKKDPVIKVEPSAACEIASLEEKPVKPAAAETERVGSAVREEDPPKSDARPPSVPRIPDGSRTSSPGLAAESRASPRRIDIQSLLHVQDATPEDKSKPDQDRRPSRAVPAGATKRRPRTPAWMLDKAPDAGPKMSITPLKEPTAPRADPDPIARVNDASGGADADADADAACPVPPANSSSQPVEPARFPESQASSADQSNAPQAKSFAEFSIKSILNCCVTPLRKISSLTLSSSLSPRVGDAGSQEMAPSPCLHATRPGHDGEIPPASISEVAKSADGGRKHGRSSAELGQPAVRSSGPVGGDHETEPSGGSLGCTTEPACMDQRFGLGLIAQQALALSQQSPWPDCRFQGMDVEDGMSPPCVGTNVIIPAEAQSPWMRDADAPVSFAAINKPKNRKAAAHPSSLPSQSRDAMESPTEPPPAEAAAKAPREAQDARPSTPEPQFCEASFASFLTPSPVRETRQAKRQSVRSASCQTILASVMKNPWKSTAKSGRRVSWAPLPNEFKSPCGMRQLLNDDDYEPFSPKAIKTERPSSPPPRTPLSRIPISGDAKFRGHFAAMSNRSGPLTASRPSRVNRRRSPSPGPAAMAMAMAATSTPSAAAKIAVECKPASVSPAKAGKAAPPPPPPPPPVDRPGYESDDGQDPLDMFNELNDYLQAYDVDAELEKARKSDKAATASRLRVEAESPW